MPTAPLLQCTFPDCTRRQKSSRCWEHKNWRGYQSYRTLRRALLLAHVRAHGLWCPGAEDHPGHAVRHAADLTVDHIIPRNRGGDHSKGNLRVLCGEFNSRRGARRPTMMDLRSEMRLRKPEPTPDKAEAVQPPPRMTIVRVERPKPKKSDGETR